MTSFFAAGIKRRRSKANFAPTWWRRVDSNHRSETQQIYSLPPLATRELLHMKLWSWWTDSNPRPADYKSAALPAELHQQFQQQDLYYQTYRDLSTGFLHFFVFSFGRDFCCCICDAVPDGGKFSVPCADRRSQRAKTIGSATAAGSAAVVSPHLPGRSWLLTGKRGERRPKNDTFGTVRAL